MRWRGRARSTEWERTPAEATAAARYHEDRLRRGGDRGRLRGGVPRGASRRRRPRWCSTSMRRTSRCMVAKRAASSTATTGPTATCRSTSSRGTSAGGEVADGRWGRRGGGGGGSGADRGAAAGRSGRRCGSSCGGTRGLPRRADGVVRGHAVDYVLGLARNERLEAAITVELALARDRLRGRRQAPVRLYKDFVYRTRASWTRARRVVGKAEHLPGKANPRFVVTSLRAARWAAGPLYAELYCARGRHGEPDQGAAAGAVCRSHEHGDDARESTAAVDREVWRMC